MKINRVLRKIYITSHPTPHSLRRLIIPSTRLTRTAILIEYLHQVHTRFQRLQTLNFLHQVVRIGVVRIECPDVIVLVPLDAQTHH